MYGRLLNTAVACLGILGAPGGAVAQSSLADLDAMWAAIRCQAQCGVQVAQDACLSRCPSLDAGWDKDGRAPVEVADHELALLEYWDAGRETLVCHHDIEVSGGASQAVVLPAPLCNAATDCQSEPEQEGCEDTDGDGLWAWQEAGAGTSDTVADRSCHTNQDCHFDEKCAFVFGHGRTLCSSRACSSDGCTAFSLTAVSTTAEEVIVHLSFDYAPSPVTVLDVKLDYSKETLVLLDARPLPALEAAGKQVSTSHLVGGELRVLVAGALSLEPVPYGAIVELVFSRSDNSRTAYIDFSDDPVHRIYSMAPEQGAAQRDLADDGFWGAGVNVGATTPEGMLLSYTFDEPGRPLALNNAPRPAELCAAIADCPGNSKELKQLAALQEGAVFGGVSIAGVRAGGSYLRGGHDHIRFPLTHAGPQQRDFTLAGWFYAEAYRGSSAAQVLFAHLHGDGLTAFGLMLEPGASDSLVDLVWFEGQYDQTSQKQVLATVERLRWTHVALSHADAENLMHVYVDGVASGEIASSTGLACPQVDPGLVISKLEGEGAVYTTRTENGLARIERMDPLGLAVEEVLGNGELSYRDPDYSPVFDRLVFVSNEGGSDEIWTADRDGNDRMQVTSGFGDRSRGISARRPRWAGKGIVFDSNIYDVGTSDNPARTSQLYFVPTDNEGSPSLSSLPLKYPDLLAAGTVSEYRLTSGAKHSSGAVWLEPDPAGGSDTRGDLLYTSSSNDRRSQSIKRLEIENPSQPTDVELGAGASLTERVRLLDAYSSEVESSWVQKALVERSWSELAAARQYRLEVLVSDVVRVTVYHDPTGYDAMCWDLDGDMTLDVSTEDLDGDGAGSVADCYPSEIRDLFIAYDPVLANHEITEMESGALLESEDEGGFGKIVSLEDAYSAQSAAALLRLQVSSPRDDRPIPAGIELATLVFTPLGDASASDVVAALSLQEEVRRSEVYVKTLGAASALVDVSIVDDARAGAFSPDGSFALVAGFWRARPVLARVDLESIEALRLAPGAEVLSSLSFRRQEELLPCNWVGAYRDRYTGLYRGGLRGGVDELTLYNYARESEAILSEVERGREWLALAGDAGTPKPRAPTCNLSDVECPPFMLCNREAHRCETVRCGADAVPPEEPESCERGLCTLRPLDVESDTPGVAWVCSAECVTDNECFMADCLNGPCRFCDSSTSSCVECRKTVRTTGSGLPPRVTVEGCPDASSYTCENGSCYTECYSFDNNQSEYLCHAPNEYCDGGRCVPVDWTWASLSPATLNGAGDTVYGESLGWETVATDHLIPVKIQAFGISDYLHPPQLLVEGCRTGGSCFEIGEIEVDNRTSKLERTSEYVLRSAWRFDRLRLRLVIPPHDNLTHGATGWLGDQSTYCDSAGVVPDPCVHKAPGSLYTLGYASEVPYDEVLRAVGKEDRHAGRAYLRPGSPAIIVTQVTVPGTGTSQPDWNRICSYEGSSEPLDFSGATPRQRKMFFGADEVSNHRERFCSEQDCGSGYGLVDIASQRKNWGVLNCAFADGEGGNIASAVYEVAPAQPSDSNIENTNICLYRSTEQQCYEWAYRPTIDVFAAEVQLFNTLDFEDFGSLGVDDGFTTVSPQTP